PIGTDPRAGNPIRANLVELSACEVQRRHSIGRVVGRRLVLVSQAEIDREGWLDPPIVLNICGPGIGPHVNRIVQLRLNAECRKPEQQIAEAAPREGASERKLPAREQVDTAIQPNVAYL